MSGVDSVHRGERRIAWLGTMGFAAILLLTGCTGRWTEDWKEMAAIQPVGRGLAYTEPAMVESEIVEAEVDEALFDDE